MAKQSFDEIERYALIAVHGDKCYLCGKPLTLSTMEVDHIIPESLLIEPQRLGAVLEAFGFPATFDLHSFENLLPACDRCNNLKQTTVFEAVPIVMAYFAMARTKADRVREQIMRGLTDRQLKRALSMVKIAVRNGQFEDADLKELRVLVDPVVAAREPDDRRRPVLISQGLALVIKNGLVSVYRGRYGIGGAPSGDWVDPSFICPTCGATAWNGARCVNCGQLSDE